MTLSQNRSSQATGALLVFGSALLWSLGGTIARFITADQWTVVFWRSLYAALFLLGFLVLRDGVRGTVLQFRSMGRPGLLVSACFAVASTSFVVALQFTTVANILLVQAGVPLLAALMAWVFFKEYVGAGTWVAIAAVMVGIGIMQFEAFGGELSPIGSGLAMVIAVMFSIATVTTRRHSDVHMTPAVMLGTVWACLFSLTQISAFKVSAPDLGWLVVFGALNLGLGLGLFALGARMLPAAVAALIGTLEPVLGPIWVWLVHNEVPSWWTIVGGSIVFAALLAHLTWEWRKSRNEPGMRVGSSGRFNYTVDAPEDHFAMGYDALARTHFFSIPAENGGTPYREFYRISNFQHEAFLHDRATALDFRDECYAKMHWALLMNRPVVVQGGERLPYYVNRNA